MTPLSQAFREAVRSELEQALGIVMLDGLVEGPNETGTTIGCVYPGPTTENAENVQQEIITAAVRIFPTADRSADPLTPLSPAPLEEAESAARAALSTIAVGAGGVWYFRVTSVTPALDVYGVELTLEAYAPNEFTTV